MVFAFQKVAIIGGTGGFGSWYGRFFKSKGARLAVFSRSEANKVAADAIGAEFYTSIAGCVEGADLVIASVPIDATPGVLKEAARAAKQGCLLVDFASVKKSAVAALEEIAKTRRDLELASVHPMHGPRAAGLEGVPVVFISVQGGERCAALKSVFEHEGGQVVESTAEEHDSVLSVVQGLTHFACISSASAMKEAGVDLKRAREFASPLFEVFLSAVGRVVLQNPGVYAKIQVENPQNKVVRKIFARQVRELSKTADGGDSELLAKKIQDAGRAFKSVDELLLEGDKATSAMDAEARQLRLLAGKKVALENVQTRAVHYGVLRKALGKAVVLAENSKETRLNVSNVRLLGKSEFSKWREKNVKTKSRDYSLAVPKSADEKIVAQAVAMARGVQGASVVGVFEGAQVGEGKKSVTVRCAFFEDEDAKELDARVKKIISGLGFSLR